MPGNDNGLESQRPLPVSSGAHGRAALVLVESLIHVLIERSALTIEDAMDIVATALEVQAEVAEAADGAGQVMWQSHSLLSAIAKSLQNDGNVGDGHPKLDAFQSDQL